MVDWLHCNTCYLQPCEGGKFSLTSCGHIYCEKCVSSGCNQDRCKMCGSQCTSTQLTNQMKPDVEMFFLDPLDLVKKYLKQVIQVMDFQRNHRRRLTSYVREKVAKQQMMIHRAQKSLGTIQDLEKDIMKLKEENSYLKKLINEKGLGSTNRSPCASLRNSPGYRGSPKADSNTNSHAARPSGRINQNLCLLGNPGYYQETEKIFQGVGALFKSTFWLLLDRSYCLDSQSPSPITHGRVLARTPPSHGVMGSILKTPSPPSTPRQVSSSHIRPIMLPSPNYHGSSLNPHIISPGPSFHR